MLTAVRVARLGSGPPMSLSPTKVVVLAAVVVSPWSAAFAGRSADSDAPASHSRPNIVFFLSDDQRAGFLGCAGHPILKTPAIDRLAAGGVRFENAFVT